MLRDFLFTGNHSNKRLHLLLFTCRQLAHLAQRLHQFALFDGEWLGGEDNTAFHHFDIYRRAGGKTGGFQPLTFQGDGGNTAVIRVATRITHG